MLMHFACPQCGAAFTAPDDTTGPSVECPKCRAPVVVLAGVSPADNSANFVSSISRLRSLLHWPRFLVAIAAIAAIAFSAWLVLSELGFWKAPEVTGDELVVKRYILEMSAARPANDVFPAMPASRIEFISWGPHSASYFIKDGVGKDKEWKIIRVVFRQDGKLKDICFTVIDGEVKGGGINTAGDKWIEEWKFLGALPKE
jgi:hypothetical protein